MDRDRRATRGTRRREGKVVNMVSVKVRVLTARPVRRVITPIPGGIRGAEHPLLLTGG